MNLMFTVGNLILVLKNFHVKSPFSLVIVFLRVSCFPLSLALGMKKDVYILVKEINSVINLYKCTEWSI